MRRIYGQQLYDRSSLSVTPLAAVSSCSPRMYVRIPEGTPTALLDRFGLSAPNLRTQLRWVEHNMYWIHKFSFRRF